jgi:hypothetical protein
MRVFPALLCTLLLAIVPTACGSSAGALTTRTPKGATAVCLDATVGALEGVARRIYGEVAEGRILAQALRRVLASSTLAEAVRNGEAKTATRILRELKQGQIVRVGITRTGRKLTEVGAGGAVAPARGRLTGAGGETLGEVELSIETAEEYAKTVQGITGMQLLVHSAGGLLASTLAGTPAHMPEAGTATYRGVSYRVASFPGKTFAGRNATFSVFVPEVLLAQCHTATRKLPTAEIVADTLGGVAMNIYRGELSSPKVQAVVREVETAPAFRTAVEQRNPAVARAEIIDLFESRLHVVRVRVETPSGVLVDVGGPYVLAPVRGAIRGAHGRVIGHFLLALQDDEGYLLLAHAFTGAQVLMREGATQVMGTLTPGPVGVPDHGRVLYGGVSYQAYSFVARAFPEGALRISLLFG